MCILSIKVPIRKKSGNLFKYPRRIYNCKFCFLFETYFRNDFLSHVFFLF